MLNDHFVRHGRRLGETALMQYASRAECDLDTFQQRIRAAIGGGFPWPTPCEQTVCAGSRL